jgi:hypothetical protein
VSTPALWIALAVCAAALVALIALSIGFGLTRASDREARDKRETGEIGGER